MAEPASTAALAPAAIILSIIGPEFGQHGLMIMGGLAGSMHSLGRAHTPTRSDAVFFVLLWTVTSALCTGFVSWAIERYLGIPARQWPAVVALAISAIGDRWPDALAWIWRNVQGVSARIPGGKEPRP
jgi:hypothetical protein